MSIAVHTSLPADCEFATLQLNTHFVRPITIPPCAFAGADQHFRRNLCQGSRRWRQILDGNGLVFGVVGIPRRHSQRPAMFQKWFRQARASRLLP